MNISAEDVKTYATDLKVATERVVATRKGLTDYQNALLELYDALENIVGVVSDQHAETHDTALNLFDRVSEITGLDDVIFFGGKDEESAKLIVDGLNEIAESGGIKDSEEDM